MLKVILKAVIPFLVKGFPFLAKLLDGKKTMIGIAGSGIGVGLLFVEFSFGLQILYGSIPILFTGIVHKVVKKKKGASHGTS